MIPVARKLAPKGFHKKVYRPGRRWLKKKGYPLSGPAGGIKLKPYWRRCLKDLHERYGGLCAYVCVFIEKLLGAHSADHFVAKSRAIEHVYRWSNYRLACFRMNARKCDFDDVLDPFTIDDETFHINFFDGSIAPNPALSPALRRKAQDTIDLLGLDDLDCREMRARHYDDYRLRGIPLDHLARHSPFVWREILRQKLVFKP